MTRCPVCSGENADTQRFCGECGTPLPASAPRNTPVPKVDETILLPTAELEPGTVFARRYQVIESLGAGGMGRVYRVLDKKVGEEVALKLIRPDVASDRRILTRFAQELSKGRQVVHRNVARMFDFNEEGHVPYFTMEYVRGESLKHLIRKVDRLAPEQAIPFACQICAGLEAIHDEKIVHHDLKPQNIMIDEDGQAKILDFGLARSIAGGSAGPRPSLSGTPAYVAPERVAGQPVDHRADIYALGIVLYEMLTGRTPFQAESLDELLRMHAHERPKDPRVFNPGISAELSRVIMKCLEKEPDQRFQSAAEVGSTLECLKTRARPRWQRIITWIKGHKLAVAVGAAGLTAAALFVWKIIIPWFTTKPWEPSVAVLPIEDLGIEEANRRFLTGLQREISDRLTGVPGLRVIPDSTVSSYDFKGKNDTQISRGLRARYLVRVSVEVEGGKVDVAVHLIDPSRDEHPPPKYFSKDISDYRTLQDEIAIIIAKSIGVHLALEKLKKYSQRGTDNLMAYGFFLEGMELLEAANNEEQARKAVETLGRAVALDPGYALGHWGLGYAYERLYYSRRENKDSSALDKMYWHFKEASQIDPTFAETNLGLGWYYFNKGDNASACGAFRKALELNRGGYLVNRDTGAFLRSIGLYTHALRYLSRASRLSPLDIEPLAQIAQCWLFLGQCEEALKYTRKALAIREGAPEVLNMHIGLLGLTGRIDEAESQIRALERFDLRDKRLSFIKETVAALRDGRGKPFAFVNDSPGLSPLGTYLYLAFGMKEEALANIAAGIDKGFKVDGTYYYSYPSLDKNPWYKVLRGDPRFQEILARQQELYKKELKPLEEL